jgi:DNA-directed RNA polymerase specialized sigma24 family protein
MAPDLRDRLTEAAEARREAAAELDRRTEALRTVVAEAYDVGVPITTIARTTDLSRTTVYGHLRAVGRL